MKVKFINALVLMIALLSFGSITCFAMSYDEAYETISAQFSSSSSNLGNYDALKAQLPDVSGSFNIMSQADLDATMNSYSAEIQNKYQSSISTAQANAQSSSAEAMANISARAKSIQNGIDPDTGEAYSSYIANHTPTYDADAWLAGATANLSSNISTLQNIVGEAEMPENPLLTEVQDQYGYALDNYNALLADYETSKDNVGNNTGFGTYVLNLATDTIKNIGSNVSTTIKSLLSGGEVGEVQEWSEEEAVKAETDLWQYNTSATGSAADDLNTMKTEQEVQQNESEYSGSEKAQIMADYLGIDDDSLGSRLKP